MIPGKITDDRPDADGGRPLPAERRAQNRDGALHRVRVGVTGLAVVFLLTVLAAALFSLLGQDDHGTTRLANGMVVTNGALPPEAPREPLAELGVAPGNPPAGKAVPPASPPAKVPGATTPSPPHK